MIDEEKFVNALIREQLNKAISLLDGIEMVTELMDEVYSDYIPSHIEQLGDLRALRAVVGQAYTKLGSLILCYSKT